MNKINEAIYTIHYIDYMSSRNKWINNIHPLVKLLITIFYITAIVSFNKYELSKLLGMSIYIIVIFILGEIPIKQSFKQIKMVLYIICVIGIINSFIDTTRIIIFSNIHITSGIISMITLILKGIFTVLASYLLIVTTSIEKICYALKILHIPKSIITLILLIYRYIIILLKDTEKIITAYKLRAPNQNGINIKVWGSLVGQFLLRSIDMAQNVYESMILRGYNGNFIYVSNLKNIYLSFIYFCIFGLYIIIFINVNVFEVIGNIFIY